jgi:HD-GYP domain-containing protein (c-di-GMP phosphodiesterase class II)
MEDLALYNSKIIEAYIKFVKQNYSYVSVRELLEYSGIEPQQVDDQAHWLTQSQVDRFHEKLVQLTNNSNIAREAGRFAASPEVSGLMRPYILSQIGPAKVYELIGKTAPLLTRSSTFQSKRIESNKIEIIVSPKDGVEEKKYQCDNRMGYFDAVALVFKNRLPNVEHPECMFKDGKVCRYTIKWQNSKSFLFSKIRNYLFFLFLLLSLFIFFVSSTSFFVLFILLWLIILLILTLLSQSFEKKELDDTVSSLKESTDKMIKSVNVNYDIALLTNELGIALGKEINIDLILNNVINILQKRLDYDRGMILLSNKEKTRLIYKDGFGYNKEQLRILKNAEFNIDKKDSKATFVVSYRDKKPFIVNELREIKDEITQHSYEFAKKMGTKSFICVPITFESESLGLLVVDNLQSKRPLIQSDINLLMGIAPQIGISIRNASLTKAKFEQFNSILYVLAASIDARDFLTAGHSEKVMEFSIGICNELRLTKEYTEMIRIAALLHDYGKIGVPDAILKKSGKLTPDEYQEIQTHAAKTRTILERISFEGLYTKIPEIAGCHHEKLDGSGYPKGLRGEEIPLGARIIAVADFFEAITAKRHYREPMQIDDAMKLLSKEADVRLDGKIIQAFKRFYSKEYGWTPSRD